MSAASDSVDTARVLSAFAARLTFEQLPDEVVETTRLFIADYLAACYAGLRVNARFNAAMMDIVEAMNGGARASVLALGHKLSEENAAFMNAVYAHGADLDDGNRKAMGHVAAHVMSAVFALAEALGNVTWRDVFTAVNVGYEVYNRLAAMAQPELVHRGFHSTGTAGAVACGAACAKLMGLDGDGIYSAMGIAAIQASGLIIIAESAQACKPLNPANAARTGILSAKLAQRGVAGPSRPLDSDKGWLHAMTDAPHREALEGLGERFTIMESYLKPYPSCRHTHCGIEAAIEAREELAALGMDAEDIASADLYIYENAIRIAGQIRVPATPDEAKFSVHYSLAVALLTGGYTLDDLDAPVTPRARALVDKLRLVPDATMEDTASGVRGARLALMLKDGRRIEKTVLLPKGDPVNPFTWTDMERKLSACMKGASPAPLRVAATLRAVRGEDAFPGVAALVG